VDKKSEQCILNTNLILSQETGFGNVAEQTQMKNPNLLGILAQLNGQGRSCPVSAQPNAGKDGRDE
jgi:hypothetical protein